MTPVLWSIVYSPWSERARWALDYCGVSYRRRSYRPMLDELALRRTLGRFRGPVSAPILETDEGVLDDSFAIAQYADAHAAADRRLFLPDLRPQIEAYNELASRGMGAGRALALRRVLGDQPSLRDLIPSGPRRLLGPFAARVAAFGVRRTLQKYADSTPNTLELALREALDALRADLKPSETGEPSHLLGQFSYADVTAAQLIAFVEPPKTHLRLTEATRASYRNGALAESYRDLVDWRDSLYGRYRGPDTPRKRPS